MTALIIDTPNCTTPQLIHLLADSVVSVGRYLTTLTGSSKLIQPQEARGLGVSGIRLFVVFEVYGGADGVNDISAKDGVVDAQFCLQWMPKIGAPTDGSVVIFFACDDDFNAAKIQSMALPYFAAIGNELKDSGYLVGVYGSGAVCRAACAPGAGAVRAWLSGSMGWAGSREYLAEKPPELVLVQRRMDTRVANLDVDTNEALGPIGDFLPFKGAKIMPATQAQINAAAASLNKDLDAMVEQKAPGFLVAEVEAEIKGLATQWAANALAAADAVSKEPS